MSTEIVKTEPSAMAPVEVSFMERLARDPAIDIEKLTKIVELQERMEAKQAEAAWNAAMARTQANITPIIKNAASSKNKYANLSAVCEMILPVASAEGLSVTADSIESPIANHLRIVQMVSHAQGFSRSYHLDLPYDGKGSQGGQIAMNPIQAIGSTVSYGRRYLLLMAFGASTMDDTDGNLTTKSEPVNADILSELIKAIESSDTLDALKVAFAAAHKASEKDKSALDSIIKVYDAAKVRLAKPIEKQEKKKATEPPTEKKLTKKEQDVKRISSILDNVLDGDIRKELSTLIMHYSKKQKLDYGVIATVLEDLFRDAQGATPENVIGVFVTSTRDRFK